VDEFDSGEHDSGILEGLEAQHGGASSGRLHSDLPSQS
jgi:hypothetical protein